MLNWKFSATTATTSWIVRYIWALWQPSPHLGHLIVVESSERVEAVPGKYEFLFHSKSLLFLLCLQLGFSDNAFSPSLSIV